jgi:release factor glutamine methyltransferase
MAAARQTSTTHDGIPHPNVGAALIEGRRQLACLADSPGLEASLLLAAALARPRAWIVTHPEAPLSSDELAAYRRALADVSDGKALPYVLGEWEFYGRVFDVTPDVLIPRPETELLVDHALEFTTRRRGTLRGIDIGTGSGCIAVTLAASVPRSHWLATDVDPRALHVARRNAQRHDVRPHVHLVCCDQGTAMTGGFDLVCANLPYVPAERLSALAVARREPRGALDGGPEGLDLILRLIADLPRLVASGGRALLEIDHTQAEAVLRAAHSADAQAESTIHADLAGQPRLLQVDRRG